MTLPKINGANRVEIPAYHRWRAMVDRCTNPKCHAWEWYGGSGVQVCDRWNPSKGGSFENFYADMGDQPKGKWLDKDKLGDGKLYSPETCCWLTPREQMKHRRHRSDCKVYEYQGQKLSIWDWAKKLQMKPDTLRCRLAKGWSVEKALSTPIRKRRKPSEQQQHQ